MGSCNIYRDVLLVAALVLVAGSVVGQHQADGRAIALNGDVPDLDGDGFGKKQISNDDKLMMMRLFMEEPEGSIRDVGEGDMYLSPSSSSGYGPHHQLASMTASESSGLRFPRLRILDTKRPSTKRQMIFHPCYFNPVSCFRRR